MSPQYVYAILDRRAVLPPGLTGIGDRPLSPVPYRDLAAATSVLDVAEIEPTVANALRHEGTVEALRRAGPALPVRFGTVLADRGAVERALEERYDALMGDLRRLGETVELGLTVLWGQSPEASLQADPADMTEGRRATGGPGTRYLRERLTAHQQAAALRGRAVSVAAMLHAALGPYALDERLAPLSGERIAVRVAYLLLPGAVSEFQAAFERLRTAQPDMRFLLSGPWPPYSFVTAGAPGQSTATARDPAEEDLPTAADGTDERR